MVEITTLYAPYDFETDTDGPGCGQAAHDSDCLCDVKIGATKPTVDSYPLLRTAAKALYERDVAPTLGNLLSELLGIFEACRPAQLTLTANEVASLVQEYHEAAPRQGGYQARPAVTSLINGGLDMVTVANLLGVEPITLGLLFVREADDTEGAARVVKAAMMLHSETYLFVDVATACGLSEQIIWNLAATLGYRSSMAAKRAAGDGDKYDAATRAEVVRLREQGVTYPEIGRRLGMPKQTAKSIVRRHNEKRAA